MTQSLEPHAMADRTAPPCWKRWRASGAGIGPYGVAFGRAVRWCRTADGGAASAVGGVEVLMDGPPDRVAQLLLPPATEGTDLVARVQRADTTLPTPVTVGRVADDGRLLARQDAAFAPGTTRWKSVWLCRSSCGTRSTRMSIEGEQTRRRHRAAGRALAATSGRAGFRQAGGREPAAAERPLLPWSGRCRPSARSGAGRVLDLMNRDLSVLILADIGP